MFGLLLIVTFGLPHGHSDIVPWSIGREYDQSSYVPVRSPFAHFNMNSKLKCLAQCARLSSTCNIAVVIRSPPTFRCVLYGESFTSANLIPATNSIVVHFGRNLSSSGCISIAGITALASYNVITLTDLSIVTGVHYRTIVCGSLVSMSSTEFARSINPATFPASSYSVELNGALSSGNPIQVIAGSFGVSAALSHVFPTMNNMTYSLDSRTVVLQQGNQGSTINVNANLTAQCSAIQAGITSLSNELAALAVTPGNNASVPTSQAGPLNFYVNAIDANGMAVFNLDGNTVLNNPLVQQIEIIVGPAVSANIQLVVINLSGASVTFAQGNLYGTWLSTLTTGASHTIWNFYQATTIVLVRSWMGALLAPNALVTTNSNIDGVVAVGSLSSTAEVRNPPIAIPACA